VRAANSSTERKGSAPRFSAMARAAVSPTPGMVLKDQVV
jgi:hypothetical protein